jgi:alkylhydroperoxidase family enzyme
MLDPGAAIGHNMQAGRSYAIFEMQVPRWHQLDRGLRDLAVMAAATTIGCAWCLGFGYWKATVNHSVPVEKIRAAAEPAPAGPGRRPGPR